MDLNNGFPLTGLVRLFQIDSGLRRGFGNELVYSLHQNDTCILPLISQLTFGNTFITKMCYLGGTINRLNFENIQKPEKNLSLI